MRALTFQGVEHVEYLNDLPDPHISDPGDVVVAVRRSGICGSDLHQYHGREPVRNGTIPGHEFVGEIVETGSEVCGLRIGDDVFSPFTANCGHCFFCENGLSGRCDRWTLFGYLPPEDEVDTGRGIQGAQAEFIRVPMADATLLKIPQGITDEQALLLGDNFTTGFFCAGNSEVRRDGITVMIGCGSVGLCAIQAAMFLGAETVVAVDPVADRRARAQSLGAIAVTPEEAADRVASLAAPSGRGGADSVMEAVGSPAAQDLAFRLVRPGGVISAIGVHTSDSFTFSPTDAYNRNVTYRAGRCPVRSMLDRVLSLVEDEGLTIPVEQIMTHCDIPLADGAEAYRRFSSRIDDCMKVTLDVGLST